MSNLTLISLINSGPSKRVSVSQLPRSEINHQSTDDNVGWDASVVNRPIPLPLNDNTAASVRNWLSVSDSEVSSLLVVTGACWGHIISGSQVSGGLVANVQT